MKKKCFWRSLSSWCNRNEWMIFLVILMIILRLPSLFAPHHYGDEEIYFVMGRAWLSKEGMYTAAFDHKPPLIYILAGIAQNVFWFRLILLLWMVVHTYVFWQIVKMLWAKDRPKLAYVSSLVFVLLTSWPLLEGNIANAELFMMMPISAAWLILLKAEQNEYQKFFWAGLLAGVALLFKIPALFDFVAILLFFLVFEKKSLMEGVKSLVGRQFWLAVGGFLLPFLMTVAYYYWRGIAEEYLRATLIVNFGYASSWKGGGNNFDPFQSGLLVRGLVLGGYTLILYLVRKMVDRRMVLGLLWLGFASFGALLSARPYPHYLQQPAVPVALLLPFIFVAESVIAWLLLGGVIFLGIVVQNHIGFWGYPTKKIYVDFWQYLTGKITSEEYRNTFDGAKMNYAVADYLRERMTKEDKLFVWSSDVAIYNLTNKLPAGGRYMVNFHVRDWNAWDEVMHNLEKNKPKYVVLLPEPMAFGALFDMLEREYLLVAVVEGAKIYQRVAD